MTANPPKRIAFYAPMKAPDHPVPSGDRAVARLVLRALEALGHEVTVASSLRVFLRKPDDRDAHAGLVAGAQAERARLSADWAAGAPDLWVCYHPYYKSPDLLGPPLCRDFGIPWITVEASLSARRSVGLWAPFQAAARDAVDGAHVNIALTARDALGLHEVAPDARVARLAPFVAAAPFLAVDPRPEPGHLVTVAMMRPGDKLDSYVILAGALAQLPGKDWRLTVVGDGPARAAVQALFAPIADRVTWVGQTDAAGVRQALARGAVYLWPGCGEAFGMAYLEAQAAGLPVVAMQIAGVPEVVADGETGLLTPPQDVGAYAAAIRRILDDTALRTRLAHRARTAVRDGHDLPRAAQRLGQILDHHVWAAGQ